MTTRQPSGKGRYKDCAKCGTPFWATPSGERKGGKYCSRRCWMTVKNGSADPSEAFWMKVDKGPRPKGCWLYTGFRKWDGYGWLARAIGGKQRYLTAHRYAWILTHGEPEKGKHILHECDNPPCCNPAHLKLGTHQENHADKVSRGRQRNSRSPKHTLLHPHRVRPQRPA